MKKVKFLFEKLEEHYKEMGFLRTIKWLFFAVKFRTLNYVAKKRVVMRDAGNILRKKYNANYIRKTSKKIFIFASVPYYDIGGGQRSAQFAKTFNSLGYEVYYIFGSDSSESRIYNMEIPTIRHVNVNNYKESEFKEIIAKDDIVILEFPAASFLPFVKIARQREAKIVYENIDNWETSLSNGKFDRDVLLYILSEADLLVGTAKPLVLQLKNYLKELKLKKDILYVPNAVDDVIFDTKREYEKPHDFIEGKKTLIYYGSLWGEWFDWDLVYGIAKKNPTYSILLIGEEKCIKEKVAAAPKNVHFLGIKKQTDLPAYLKFSDFAIIPFKVDQIGEYVSPLKIFEYIAMNKMVLSTSLPEVKDYPNTCVGDSVKEWDAFLKKKYDFDNKNSEDFIKRNNWYNRSLSILEYFDGKKRLKCSFNFYKNLSVIVLNYNNKNCIFDCVDSLLRFNKRYKYSVIVVDNGSTDGSYEELKRRYGDKIKLIRNVKNGCSSGRNLGVKHSFGDYLMFLDSDQFVLNDYWLDNFLDLIERKNLQVGAIGWSGGWLKAPKKGMSSIVDDYPYRYMPADMLARIDLEYLATDGFLITRKMFDEVGGFDERYDPTCFEDTDLSFAIRNEGKELIYCPYLGVYHIPHQTTKSGSWEHERLLRSNEKKFLDKWSKKNKKLFLKIDSKF